MPYLCLKDMNCAKSFNIHDASWVRYKGLPQGDLSAGVLLLIIMSPIGFRFSESLGMVLVGSHNTLFSGRQARLTSSYLIHSSHTSCLRGTLLALGHPRLHSLPEVVPGFFCPKSLRSRELCRILMRSGMIRATARVNAVCVIDELTTQSALTNVRFVFKL